MPKKIEKRLEKEASVKGLRGRRWRAYVYGTLARIAKQSKGKSKKL